MNRSAKPGIPRHRRHELCREVAAAEVPHTELARKYGVTKSAITQFATRHAHRIDEIRSHLDDEFAGLWIARKARPIAALEADYERTLENAKADHHEWVKARIQMAHAVAEELGQLPPRQQIMIAPVTHILVSVDVAECFPDAAQEGEQGGT